RQGAGAPRRGDGWRTTPPRFAHPPPCPKPPRAKPGVDATTQAAATNIAAKTRFMIVTPHFAPPLDALESNHPRTTTFSLRCLALSGLALIRRQRVRHRTRDKSVHRRGCSCGRGGTPPPRASRPQRSAPTIFPTPRTP